jgi:hypothetical protein
MNCPKHVEFCSKNKFEKIVHLVSFIIRIYHDARSPERQKCNKYDGMIVWTRSLKLEHLNINKGKSKVIPLQARCSSEGG